jgi:hypothetical protein
MMSRANGRFEVKLTPQATDDTAANGALGGSEDPTLARYSGSRRRGDWM